MPLRLPRTSRSSTIAGTASSLRAGVRRPAQLALAGSLAVAVCLAAGAAGTGPADAGTAARGEPGAGAQAQGPPAEAWAQEIQRDLAAREYEITWQKQTRLKDLPAAWHAPNRAHGFRTYFTEDGIRVVPQADEEPSWTWELTLVPGPEARISNLESLRNREFK